MSAGPAVLFGSSSHFELAGGSSSYDSNTIVEMDNNHNNSSAFSDEDLIASLAGFAVEGQTEKDLATIKAMLMSQHGHNQFQAHQQSFTHNSYNSSNGGNGGGMWPMQSPAATTAWSAFNWNTAQPPPNTPTLSKSLELYGSSANNNGYYNNGNEYSSSRRRDVSLERPHLLNTASRTSSHTRNGRSSSITSNMSNVNGHGSATTNMNDDNNSTPGSSLSNGFDMDMEEEEEEEVIAGPSNAVYNGYRPAGGSVMMDSASMTGNNGNNGMEDIQEDSMREQLEDIQHHQRPTSAYPADHHSFNSTSSITPSSANLNFDNRNAGIAGAGRHSPPSSTCSLSNQQRKRSSIPINGQSISRPNSSNSNSASSPPQTRSRSRQQQAAASQMRFTSPP